VRYNKSSERAYASHVVFELLLAAGLPSAGMRFSVIENYAALSMR